MINKLLLTTLALLTITDKATAQSSACQNDPSACHEPQADEPESQQISLPSRSDIPSIIVPAPGHQIPEGSFRTTHGTKPLPIPFRSQPPTEFQQFVQASLGYSLPLFGYNLFEDVPSTFAPLEQVQVPASYVVGPGDELVIRAWGQVNVDAKVTIGRDGSIFIPTVGQIAVAGIRYDQLASRLKEAAARVFRNFDLTVTLGQLRSIQVYVVGNARKPGSYTVSSLSTLVNALFAAGGPSQHGSMRHIQVKRDDRLITDFDLYDLLLKGDKSKDVVLQPGDVIYIPHTGPEVAVAGSVTFPAIYELRGASALGNQLEAAGGLSSVADGDRVIIERVDDHATRKVEEFRLDAAGKARELKDGDLVRVFSISPRFEATVTLRGNVAQPGRYPFRSGMRLLDLIPDREFLLTRSFWQVQNGNTKSHMRPLSTEEEREDTSNDQHNEQPGSARDEQRHDSRESEGAESLSEWESQPDLPDSKDGTAVHGQAALHNDISLSAPDINWDYAVIQRLNQADLSTTLVTFNLGKAILGSSDADNVPLQSGDVITIFSQRDIAVPDRHQNKYVRLEGEFRAPGVYKVNPGETLQSLAARAGGLTDDAFLFGTEFTRDSAAKQQQASLDRMVANLELEAQRQAVYLASNSDQAQSAPLYAASHQTLIEKLRGIKATGRVVLDLSPGDLDHGSEHTKSLPDIALEDGDRFFVPRQPTTVNVVGAVFNQTSFIFRSEKRLLGYLKESGGGTRDADMSHVFIVRADGRVLTRKNSSGMFSGGLDNVRALPGDTIVVPVKLDKGATMRAIKDWSQVVGQIGLGAAAINVLK